MAAPSVTRLALLVRGGPFQGRSARDQLDVALAAASLEYTLELFFLGMGALQLLDGHHPGPAGLPRGSRGWKSLSTLTRVHAWVEPGVLERLAAEHRALLLEPTELAASDMAERVARCALVWVV